MPLVASWIPRDSQPAALTAKKRGGAPRDSHLVALTAKKVAHEAVSWPIRRVVASSAKKAAEIRQKEPLLGGYSHHVAAERRA
jgi:hypothetical protein